MSGVSPRRDGLPTGKRADLGAVSGLRLLVRDHTHVGHRSNSREKLLIGEQMEWSLAEVRLGPDPNSSVGLPPETIRFSLAARLITQPS